MDLTNPIIIAIVVIILLIIGGKLAVVFSRRQRTRRLKDRFGPEYDRTLGRLGDRRQAEEELQGRLEHLQDLHIRALSPEEVNHFALEWEAIQAQFVDTPLEAVQKANRLIREAMGARGYPVEDFDQRVADISVDYPDLAAHYRELHDIATKGEQQKMSTEAMRQAMLHGRTLFENLLQSEGKAEEAGEKEKETA